MYMCRCTDLVVHNVKLKHAIFMNKTENLVGDA